MGGLDSEIWFYKSLPDFFQYARSLTLNTTELEFASNCQLADIQPQIIYLRGRSLSLSLQSSKQNLSAN